MKVDYSTFKEDESLWGKVKIIDGDAEKIISVELRPNYEIEVTEDTKRSFEFFLDNYEKYKNEALKVAFEYYGQCRGEWGESELPEINDINQIKEMIDLRSVVVHDTERDSKNAIILYYDITWDKEEGMGISMKDFDVVEVGTQGSIK